MYIVDTYNSIIQAQQLNVEQKSTGLPAILRTILDHHDQPKVLSIKFKLSELESYAAVFTAF